MGWYCSSDLSLTRVRPEPVDSIEPTSRTRPARALVLSLWAVGSISEGPQPSEAVPSRSNPRRRIKIQRRSFVVFLRAARARVRSAPWSEAWAAPRWVTSAQTQQLPLQRIYCPSLTALKVSELTCSRRSEVPRVAVDRSFFPSFRPLLLASPRLLKPVARSLVFLYAPVSSSLHPPCSFEL